jgi:hypothetical protein
MEACLIVTAFAIDLMIVAGTIDAGTIHLPLEWLQSPRFKEEIVPALPLAMFAVANSLWRAQFHHRTHDRHTSQRKK